MRPRRVGLATAVVGAAIFAAAASAYADAAGGSPANDAVPSATAAASPRVAEPAARERIADLERSDPTPASFTVPLRERDAAVEIVRTPDGHAIIVHGPRGGRVLTPEQFAELIYRDQRDKPHGRLFKLLNITSWNGVAWVAIGLLGQVLFTFRMVLQWLASERANKSVVPVGFWWGSLLGGAMLLTYFIWRKDIIGILGQSTGVAVYARNLVLIYRDRRRSSAQPPSLGDDPGPEPELTA